MGCEDGREGSTAIEAGKAGPTGAGPAPAPRGARNRAVEAVNWDALIDEEAIRALLAPGVARFARPVRDALVLFLSGLPAEAQSAVLDAQAALPGAAGVSERLAALVRQCPVLHKLGQSLSRDRRLDGRLRRELRKLETLPCSVPVETLGRTLRRELGGLEELGIRLESAALAEASVAVVIGYQDPQRSGVFKILKPGIEERLELELELLARIGLHLDERCSELGLPKLAYEQAFRQVREKLRDEVRLTVEQRNLALAAEQYARDDRVEIPALHGYCTGRVTAMARVTGRKVTDHGLPTPQARRELADLLATALLARPLFSTRDQALFHGDPHAGNLLLTPEGRLAVLDWSLAGTLSQRDREAMVHLIVGALTLDERQVLRILESLSPARVPDAAALASVVRGHLAAVRDGRPPDFGWLLGLMDDAAGRAGLRAGGELLTFRKALHTLQGVLADLDPNTGSIDRALAADFLGHLASEWPLRWLSGVDSRRLPTRLSNADLASLMLVFPLAATRFWLAGMRPPGSAAPPDSAEREPLE